MAEQKEFGNPVLHTYSEHKNPNGVLGFFAFWLCGVSAIMQVPKDFVNSSETEEETSEISDEMGQEYVFYQDTYSSIKAPENHILLPQDVGSYDYSEKFKNAAIAYQTAMDHGFHAFYGEKAYKKIEPFEPILKTAIYAWENRT